MVPVRTPVLSTGYFRPPRRRKIADPFRDPDAAIAAAPAAQIVRCRRRTRIRVPLPDQRTMTRRLSRGGYSLREQFAASRQRVIEVGEAICVAVDFGPLESAAVTRNTQLRQPVFAGDVQFSGGTRTHRKERPNRGTFRRANFTPDLALRVELSQAVFDEHQHPPPAGTAARTGRPAGRRIPHRPLSVPILLQRVERSSSTGASGGCVHSFGRWPVGLRVAARLRYAGDAVTVEQAHREDRAVADVGVAFRRSCSRHTNRFP